jgi:hypothetical protein
MQDRKDFGTGVDGQPQPQDAAVAAQPCPQLIQLQIGKVEVTENVFVQRLSVLARPGQPGGHGRLPNAEDPLCCRWVQPFGQRGQYHGDVRGRGFQTIQGRVAPGSERGVARLTPKCLNRFGLAMFAVPDQCMPVRVSVAEVPALLIGTGEAFGGYPLGRSAAAFDLTPGSRLPQALQPTRQWRRVDRRGNRLACAASAGGGGCCAWPLLVKRKAEDGTGQDATVAPEKTGGKPRAGIRTRTHEAPSESSLLKNGEKGELLEKQGYGERRMLSSEWVRSPNYPPP